MQDFGSLVRKVIIIQDFGSAYFERCYIQGFPEEKMKYSDEKGPNLTH